ncbi:ABC transporter permease [Mycolicibacterium austroafricanum]|uniref:ABC transporter permease n=1 Tax=Mycolicibacterium austroafricanum TaxID=39687 RepID=A0ABT8H710_MYCAO|nr:ABC transporter permease [Mycolicibacterium austroafricanum]MDN4516550.1 ABC transporter permease [Mycolicibacterium austroafricanum]
MTRSRVGAVLATALVAVVLIILVGPIVLLAVFSFNDSSIIALPWEGFTLQWYRAAFSDPDVLDSLRNSVLLAALIAPLCVALGTATAWGITRFRFRTRAFWSGLVGAPLVIPWLVMGVSGLLLFASLDIDLSLLTVGVMHVAVTFPLVTALVSARLIRFERNQEEAAVDLGASQWQLMTKVVLPQLAPTLGAGLIFSFAWSFNNFEISFFTGGYEQTFPVWVYAVLRRSDNLPIVNAVSTAVSAVQIAVVYLMWIALREASRRRGSQESLTDLVAGGLR